MYKSILALVLAVLVLASCSPAITPPAPTTTAPVTTDTPATTAPEVTTPSESTVPSPTLAQLVDDACAALSLPDYAAWIRDTTLALISGDGVALAKTLGVPEESYACYNGMAVSDWALRREAIPAADDPTQVREMIVLDLTILSGGSEVLGPGEHSLVFVGELFAYLVPREAYAWRVNPVGGKQSAAENYLWAVFDYAGFGEDCFHVLRTPGLTQFGMADFIIGRLGALDGRHDRPRTADAIRAYAEACFGIDGASVPLTGVQTVEGGYTRYGRGGSGVICDFVGEETRDGVTVVTVQFWADYSRTVESKRMEFHLRPGAIDFVPVKVVTLRDSGLITVGYAV